MAPQAPRFTHNSYLPSIPIFQRRPRHQGKEGPQSISIGCGGFELDSGGKQCCLIKALKALSLAFSPLSCSISLSICFVLSSICFIRCSASLSFCLERCLICSISSSISRTGRQLRVAPKWRAVFNESDKNDRHRGNDEGDAPLLLEADAAAEDADVVIGGKESDQAEDHSPTGLNGTEVIQAGPGELWCW
jgi:hypothetical protein